MRPVPYALAFVLVAAAAPAFAAGAADFKAGSWETVMRMEFDGKPGQPTTTSRCMTPADARDPARLAARAPDGCVISDTKVDTSTGRRGVTCHLHGGVQTGNALVTYGPETFTGAITIDIDDLRVGRRPMVAHMNGRRVGDCAE